MADITRIVEVVLQVTNRSRRGTREFTRSTKGAAVATREAGKAAQTSTKQFDNYGKELKDTSTESKAATRDTTALGGALNKAGTEASSFGSSLGRLAGGLAGGALFTGAVKSAADFSRQIAEVGTLVDDATVSNEELRDTVRSLSNEFGQDRESVAAALYQAISSGAQAGAEANEFLEVALRLAIGGVTDARTAVDGLTTVINAFNLGFESAETVADKLFATVKAGRTTIEELSGFLFQAAPIAQALGVSFDEVQAALVGLTLQGTSSRVAFTQIRAALVGLARPSEDLDRIFKNLGFANAEAALAAEGLQFALEAVNQATGGSVAEIQKLVGSVEATQAIVGLAGVNADKFAKALDAVQNSAGASRAAFEEVNQTLGQQLTRTLTNASNAIESLGKALEPVARILLDVINIVADFAQSVTESFPGAVATITTFVGVFIAFKTGTLILRTLGSAFKFAGGQAALAKIQFELAAFSMRTFGLTTSVAVSNVRNLGRALPALAAGYIAATVAIDALIAANDRHLARLKSQFDILRDINQLRGDLVRLGVDADQLEQDLQFPLAAAFAVQDEKVRKQRLATIRAALQDLVNEEQKISDEILRQQNLLIDQQEAANARAKQDELNARAEQLEKLKRLDQEELKSRQTILRELVAAEKKAQQEIIDAKASSAEFQKSIDEQIAAQQRGDEPEGVRQARLTLQLVQDIAQARRDIAAAETQEEAIAARQRVLELAANATELQSADLRLLKLRELQRLELEATATVEERGQADIAASKEAQQTEKTRILDLQKGIKQIAEDIKVIGDPIELTIRAKTQQAELAIKRLEAELKNLRNVTIQVRVDRQGGGFAEGGVTDGRFGTRLPGFGGGDKQLVMAEAGEQIINKNRTSQFSGLLAAINSGTKGQISNIIGRMAALPRFQEGGVTAAAAPGMRVVTVPDPTPRISDKVQLDLTVGGASRGSLTGDRATVDTLINSLRDIRRALPGRR